MAGAREAAIGRIVYCEVNDSEKGDDRNGARIPKLRRGPYFPEGLIERYSRRDRAVVGAVAEMVTSGVSTRKVEKVVRTLGVDRMSASQVSRICESLDAAVTDLRERAFDGATFPCLWIDATYLKCRDGSRVSSCAVVTAIGGASSGHRVLLGVDAADAEDCVLSIAGFGIPHQLFSPVTT